MQVIQLLKSTETGREPWPITWSQSQNNHWIRLNDGRYVTISDLSAPRMPSRAQCHSFHDLWQGIFKVNLPFRVSSKGFQSIIQLEGLMMKM